MSALELHDVEVEYDRPHAPPLRAVAGASLELKRGQLIGLVGESGCGKSTLAKAAVGLEPVTAGTVTFEGEPVQALRRSARPARLIRLQLVFQDPASSLNPRRRVGAQLRDALDSVGELPRGGREARVRELLEQVGLSPDAGQRYPHQFSGGQQQRLALARALAADPSVIVLDEPLSSLDASAQAQVANLLQRICRELEIGMLLISHDLSLVKQIADEIVVMYLGKVVEQGPTEELWNAPRHPYTQALIKAIPLPDGNRTPLVALAGEVPDPARPPAGCRFHPRCPHAMEICGTREPVLQSTVPGRDEACWLHVEHEPAGA